MKLLLLIVVLLAGVSMVRADVAGEVRAVLNEKVLAKATLGVEVWELDPSGKSSKLIYKHNSERPLIPASNLKLITTAAAVEKLGADFKFKTQLAFRDGDLVLIGDGDPTTGDAELLKKVGWGTTTLFEQWAEMLKKAGIKQIKNVVVDDSVFDELFIHSNWPVDQLHKRYEAGVAGMNLNANCLDFYLRPQGMGRVVAYTTDPATKFASVNNTCVGGNDNAVWLSRPPTSNEIILRGETPYANDKAISVTIHDPALFAATVLKETIEAAGISVTGEVVRDRTVRESLGTADSKVKVLAINETPLASVLARANKDSMNLYAEALCKRVGFAETRKSGSWENGTAGVGAYLKSIGVPDDQFNLDDGCGLSKKNAISASGVAKVLVHEYHGANREAYLKSLAIAGVDGTLDDRFKRSDLIGRVFGKSGFVEGVSCLSGYVHAKNGKMYAFAILINGIPGGSNSSVKPLHERIVKAIDGIGK